MTKYCLIRVLLLTTALTVFLLMIPVRPKAQYQVMTEEKDIYPADILTGAERTTLYFPWIRDKRIAVVANHTATIGKQHLVDSLMKAGMKVQKVFCPEHGFRGNAEAGEVVGNQVDQKSGLPVVSLYGKKRKPSPEDLADVDVVIFDIQDVGARFYTYISTLNYVMEACAEQKKQVIVLDRPNPNGHYVDGPVLKKEFASFIGMNAVPIVHGMTIAEYACMLNGEGWLNKAVRCDLKYVTVQNYTHSSYYHLPLRPSPNLPNMASVWLYPSLCLFEGTLVSVGRGTGLPFQQIGHPDLKDAHTTFTPVDIPGVATDPPYEGLLCQGYELGDFSEAYIKNSGQIYLFWLLETYAQLKDKGSFFNNVFDKLAGSDQLRLQITQGMKEEDIRKSWQEDLKKFKEIRKKYLLYPDFE